MKISAIGTRNINFGKNREKSSHSKLMPLKHTALMCAALLAVAPLNKSDTKINDEFIKTNSTSMQSELYEEKFNWEKIPDYQKLTGMFYSSLIILVLINLMTGKEYKNHSDSEKY